ncbi:MAG: PilZ domain-containing protein [Spirochaetales bacterium]|nr:PilZ domain-containing protein [Spirochaetales bacterium]
MGIEEKRKFPRIGLDILINYDKNLTARAKNISCGGLLVETNRAVVKGAFMTIVFRLPGDNEDIKLYAKIAWEREADAGSYEAGLEFWHIENHDLKKIKDYIDTQLDAP